MQMPMANGLATLATLVASQKRVAYLCARASKRAERTFASKRQLLSRGKECGEEQGTAYTTFDRFNTNEAVKCFA